MFSSHDFQLNGQVTIRSGDLLRSPAQTLVNTVNTVGVMGKGIALSFKRQYPGMYDDYKARCDRGEVRLGEPYLYHLDDGRAILNFPTKGHWRSVSRLSDIMSGLQHIEQNYLSWGIKSLAVPPLGCGNGQLEWDVVGPTLYRRLVQLNIPVELYAPHDAAADQLTLEFLSNPLDARPRFVEPGMVAVIEIVRRIQTQPYCWPVGRVFLQKIAYFATRAGIPTGLSFEAGSYGPFSPTLKSSIARLQNNGVVVESQYGKTLLCTPGPTFEDARSTFESELDQWEPLIERVASLMSRYSSKAAEIAGTVDFTVANEITRSAEVPTVSQVLDAVDRWKIRRDPPLRRDAVLRSLIVLARHEWLEVQPDEPAIDRIEALSEV